MAGIGERLKTVRELSGLKQQDFASSLGLSPTSDTIYRWEREKAFPPADILAAINQRYDINLHWLVTGQGPMREARSDLGIESNVDYALDDERRKKAPAQSTPGREASSPTPSEEGEVVLESLDLDLNHEPPIEPQGFKIHDDIQIAVKVLESGTAYAVALHLNIQQFGKAVDEQAGVAQLRHTVNAQTKTIQALQSTMAQESAAMRKEVEELKSQLARLLATGEDNPDHGQEVA